MFKSIILSAFRSMRRDLGYVALNVGGLALGLATCLVIVMYIQTERSVDRFHPDQERIVRVYAETTLGGRFAVDANTAHPLADFASERFPEIEHAVRFMQSVGKSLVRVGDVSGFESRIMAAEPSFFEVFDATIEDGGSAAGLKAPNTMVVTRAFAERYFGSDNPVGRELTMTFWGAEQEFSVVGIVQQLNGRTRFEYDAIISYATYPAFLRSVYDADPDTGWGNLNPQTLFKLRPGADWKDLEARLSTAVVDVIGGGEKQWYTYFLQPLSDVHVGGLGLAIEPEGNVQSLRIFGLIGILILLIACANYMNMATARGAQRAREVGVRKVFGARRHQLRFQFLVEAAVFTGFAVMFAILLSDIAVSVVNAQAGRSLIDAAWYGSQVAWLLAAIAAITSLVAGAYPAFYLSHFEPGTVLRGAGRTASRSGGTLRRVLVVTQFTGGIALLVMTMGIRGQMDYVSTMRLGFDQENVSYVSVRTDAERDRIDSIAEAIRQVPGVHAVSVASDVPDGISQGHGVRVVNDPEDEGGIKRVLAADAHYADALGFEMVAGHWFRPDMPADAGGFVINESAARAFGMDNPLDLILDRNGQEGPVIGVVKDFHFSALHIAIQPLVIFTPQQNWDIQDLVIRADGGSATVDRIREAWTQVAPGIPFEHTYLDDTLARLYDADRTSGRLFGIFSALGIIVACLGLFGLAAFSAQQRRKEVGIRKVLGASAQSIMLLLSKEFIALVAVAFLVAIPVATWGLDRWLDAFAYRIDLGAAMYAVPAILALVIVMVTVSGQAFRAASANPTDSLRSD